MHEMTCPECSLPLTVEEEGCDATYICETEDCEYFEEEVYAETGLVVELGDTQRGFRCLGFKDRYGEECTLQKSSLATEAAIWFGTPGRVSVGPPWKDLELPENALTHSRMHLTQRQVKQLLPYLRAFAETGSLPSEPIATLEKTEWAFVEAPPDQSSSDDDWYALHEGGYIKPEVVLVDPGQVHRVREAEETLSSFFTALLEAGIRTEM